MSTTVYVTGGNTIGMRGITTVTVTVPTLA